jgi:signal peptidase I
MKRLINWGAFVIVLVAVWAMAGPTALGGPASYVIVDGRSMEPTYSHGDLVIARQLATYEVGDIIVYDAPVDAQFNVIHRIVEPTDGGFITQGDNRDTRDGWIAPHDTIYGASWLMIPKGGHIVAFIRQPAVVIGLLMGLLSFEILKHAEKRQRRRDPDNTAEVAA